MKCEDVFSELCRLAECETLDIQDRAVAKQSANVLSLLMQGVYISPSTPAPKWMIEGMERLQSLTHKE